MEVSVIIPVYNAEAFLERAVLSALQQEEVREVLLVEDGSQDNSWSLCRRLAGEHARVQALRHSDGGNYGPAATRNRGLQAARHPFIAFLDADDFFAKGRYKNAARLLLQHPEADGFYSGIKMAYESEAARQEFHRHYPGVEWDTLVNAVPPESFFATLLQGRSGAVALSAMIFRRSFLLQHRLLFDESYRMAEDTGFIWESARLGRFYGVDLHTAKVMKGIHLNNTIYNRDLEFRSLILFFEHWWEKAIAGNFPVEVNRRLFRLRLHYNRWVYRFYRPLLLRYMVKAMLTMGWMIQRPAIFTKLF